jgi:hypothetical protein
MGGGVVAPTFPLGQGLSTPVQPGFCDAGVAAAAAPARERAGVLADEGDRVGLDAGVALGSGAGVVAGAGSMEVPEPTAGVLGNNVSVTTFSVVVTGGVWAPAPACNGSDEAEAPAGPGADTLVACGRSAR